MDGNIYVSGSAVDACHLHVRLVEGILHIVTSGRHYGSCLVRLSPDRAAQV